MIKKPTVIITSLGRTGTLFFARFFKDRFGNVAAFHEAGRITLREMKISEIADSIKNFGLKKSVFNKLSGKSGIMSLSHGRMRREMSDHQAAQEIIKNRAAFIEKAAEDLYVESNYQYYGLIDVLPSVFERHKLVYIIRDPRDWVASCINSRLFYHPTDFHTLIGDRITPALIKDDEYIGKWREMDRFERLCWAWNYINNYAVKSVKNNPHASIYKFEEIFLSDDRAAKLIELMEIILDFDGLRIQKPDKRDVAEFLDRRINKSKIQNFPKWDKWSKERAKFLHEMCGSLMREFDYGKEEKWQDLIS